MTSEIINDYFQPPAPGWLPRLMVIDGCNVGRSASGPAREAVSCAGLMSVIRWLLIRDFDVVTFLPVVYNNSHNFNATDVYLLQKLEALDLITFTPARTGRGDRKAFTNYDDLYVTQMAARHGGCILSGDRFKDILARPQYSDYHDVIVQRTLDVRFRGLENDVTIHQKDIFFRAVPELFIHEDPLIRAAAIAHKIFAGPQDAEFAQVELRRQQMTPEKKAERLREIDNLLDEWCERQGTRPVAVDKLPPIPYRYDKGAMPTTPPPNSEESTGAGNDECTSPIELLDAYQQMCADNAATTAAEAGTEAVTCPPIAAVTKITSDQIHPIQPMHSPDAPLIDFFSNALEMPSDVASEAGDVPSSSMMNSSIIDAPVADFIAATNTNSWAAVIDGNWSPSQDQPMSSNSPRMPYVKMFGSKAPASAPEPPRTTETAPSVEPPTEVAEAVSHTNNTEPTSTLTMPAAATAQSSEVRVSDAEILDQLSSIFSVETVLRVLDLNASRNIDFLADQCAQMSL